MKDKCLETYTGTVLPEVCCDTSFSHQQYIIAGTQPVGAVYIFSEENRIRKNLKTSSTSKVNLDTMMTIREIFKIAQEQNIIKNMLRNTASTMEILFSHNKTTAVTSKNN